MQVVHVLAPVLDRLPASHVAQVVEPWFEYLPVVHDPQKSGEDAQREVEDVPGIQLVQTEAPVASANVPASQGRQVANTVAPGVTEYVPVLQGVHVLVSIVVTR
jgi:hypothetical protein